MNYKLTVITSTYNVGEEFHRTADSILSQKNNIQWIVCDGGSNEFSLSIINKFKRDIDILIIEKDEGIYDAWNKSTKHIKSNWVVFLGSGDVLIKKNIPVLFSHLNTSKSHIIIGNLLLFNKFGDFIKKTKNELLDKRKYKNGTLNKPVNPEVLYSKKIFNSISFNIDYKIAGDTDFYIRAVNQGFSKQFIDLEISEMTLEGVSSDPLKYKIGLKELKEINKKNNIILPFHISFLFNLKMKLKYFVFLLIRDNVFQFFRKILGK